MSGLGLPPRRPAKLESCQNLTTPGPATGSQEHVMRSYNRGSCPRRPNQLEQMHQTRYAALTEAALPPSLHLQPHPHTRIKKRKRPLRRSLRETQLRRQLAALLCLVAPAGPLRWTGGAQRHILLRRASDALMVVVNHPIDANGSHFPVVRRAYDGVCQLGHTSSMR